MAERRQHHQQERLTTLRNGLLHLHRTLVQSQRREYERDIQRIHSPGRLLGLLLHDPAFAWMRELSALIAKIDETMEESATAHDSDRLIKQARQLISPSGSGAHFETRYLEALQRDPDVVMAHAAAIKLLRSLERG